MRKRVVTYIILFWTFPLCNFAQGWNSVGSYTWNTGYSVNNLASDTGYLYASGSFIKIGIDTVNNIARWNGTTWSALGTGMKFGAGPLFTYNGKLYATGILSAGGQPFVMEWDGSTWSQLGASFNSSVATLCFYNGELYAGGDFDSVGTIVANRIAKWSGGVWSAVGSGMNNTVESIVSFKGNLYAAGGFTISGGNAISYIAKWDGSNWSALGSGLSGGGSGCSGGGRTCLAATNNFVFVSSDFTNAGGVTVTGLAQWDGANWFNVPGSMCNITTLYTDTVSNNLYAGVYLYHSVYRWDGSNWYSLCTPGTILINGAYSSALFKGVFFGNDQASGGYTPLAMCSNPFGGALGITTNYINGVILIPNPLIDKSVLDFGQDITCNISFYDVFGRKLYEREFIKNLVIDRKDFTNEGVFFFQIISNNKRYTGKLLVQ